MSEDVVNVKIAVDTTEIDAAVAKLDSALGSSPGKSKIPNLQTDSVPTIDVVKKTSKSLSPELSDLEFKATEVEMFVKRTVGRAVPQLDMVMEMAERAQRVSETASMLGKINIYLAVAMTLMEIVQKVLAMQEQAKKAEEDRQNELARWAGMDKADYKRWLADLENNTTNQYRSGIIP